MGDDSVVASRLPFAFDQLTMAEDCRNFGMFYTSATKTDVVARTERLTDIEYLRRRFKTMSKRLVLAPLRYSSVLEIPMWDTTKTTDLDRANSWLSVFVELTHYDHDLYEQVRSIAHRYSRRMGFPLTIMPYGNAYDRLTADPSAPPVSNLGRKIETP